MNLFMNSRITVAKVATIVQTAEVTSLCKSKILSIKQMGSGNKSTLDLHNGIVKVDNRHKGRRARRW